MTIAPALARGWKAVGQTFWRVGWLTPAVLPLTQVGGRALFNIVVYTFLLWALMAFTTAPPRAPRTYWILYVVLLVACLPGVMMAQSLPDAFKGWVIFGLYTSVALITFTALGLARDNLDRLERAFGLFGLVTVEALLILLVPQVMGEHFQPEHQLKEDNLPFLLPLLILWLGPRLPRPWRRFWLVTLVVAVIGYILISGGRAALMGLLGGMAVLLLAGGLVRRRVAVAAGALVALLTVAMLAAMYAGQSVRFSGWGDPLADFSSGRTVLWSQALANPPGNPWVGVGVENMQFEDDVLTMARADGDHRVQHLHNFLLDAWYETGWIGLVSLLAVLTYPVVRIRQAWSVFNGAERWRAACWLAAGAAIVVAALFSFSYTSRQFSLYLFVVIGVLMHMADSARARETFGK